MKLTKEQMQFIEDYLIEQGVKYWDVRIELIDHIATKLEENEGLSLNRTFLIKEFGTSISLDKVVFEKEKLLKKLYRSLHYKELISFLKSPKEILVFIVLTYLYYLVFLRLTSETFASVSKILFYAPILVFLFFSVFNLIKKNKSIHIESALFFLSFSIILLNPWIMNLNSDTNFKIKLIAFIAVLLNSIYIYCGCKTYLKTHKKYSELFKQFKSL